MKLVDDTLVPRLYSEQEALQEMFYYDLQAAFNGALAADQLGLSWRLDAYQAATDNEGTTKTEFRLAIWKEVVSDTLALHLDEDDPAEEESTPEK